MHGLPGFLASASAVYPSFLSVSSAAGSNNSTPLHLATFPLPPGSISHNNNNSATKSPQNPLGSNGFSPTNVDDTDNTASSIVALRLKAKEHMDSIALTKSIISQ